MNAEYVGLSVMITIIIMWRIIIFKIRSGKW